MSEIIGPYKILQECGRGSCGTVYLAQNTFSGQRSALKILDEKVEARELEGLIRCRECRHANLIQIRHIDRLPDGRLYYTMDPADDRGTGGTYQPDTLGARGRIPAEELLPILRALLDGVAALHGRKIIHRDIKPDNILFVNGVPVLGDIGLAAVSGDASLAGTPSFLPPEVLAGSRPPDERSDLYALGRVAYTVLTGLPPGKYPQIPGDLPKEAAPILSFCRAANAGDVTIGSCRKALNAPPRRRVAPSRLIASGLAIILAAAGAVMLFTGRKEGGAPQERKLEKTVPATVPAADSVALPSPTPASDIPFPKTAAGIDAVLKNTEAKLARKVRRLDATVAASQARVRAGMRRVTPDEFLAEVGKLERRYPLPDELRRRAKARYDAVRREYFEARRKHSPFTAEGAAEIARLDEAQRRLEEADLLYKIGKLTGSIESAARALSATGTVAGLASLETMFRERHEAVKKLSDAAPVR